MSEDYERIEEFLRRMKELREKQREIHKQMIELSDENRALRISFRPISEKIQTSHKDLLKMVAAEVEEYESLRKQDEQVSLQRRAEFERLMRELENRAE